MAKALASDVIMPATKLRALLTTSKKEPVQAAIGISEDGEGVVLLDRKASPRKTMAMLRSQADKAKLKLNATSLRFGRAEVDTEYDPAVVRFFINKDAPGPLRLKMTELVKHIQYQKVEFEVDASLLEEGEGEQAAPAGDASATASDVDGLTQQLRALIGRIASSDPARKAELTKLAMDAGASLKTATLDAAGEAMGRLRAALDATPEVSALVAEAAAGGTAGAVTYGKARLTWLGTRRSLAAGIERLVAALRADYAEDGLADSVEQQFRAKVDPIMAEFDESLADALDAAINQTDPAARSAIVAEARRIVGRYQTYLASEPLLAVLDDNPYEPVAMVATLTKTLSALSAAIR